MIPYFQALGASKHVVAFAARQVERYKRPESKIHSLKDMLARLRGDGTSGTRNDGDLLKTCRDDHMRSHDIRVHVD